MLLFVAQEIHSEAKFQNDFVDQLNARACLRLRAACEKLKKVLSANPEAPLNIECLMEEKDVRGFIKRDEFEQLNVPILEILERVKKPMEKALGEAGLTVEDIHAVELVGSASRILAILKIVTELFGKDPRRTMNASQCVSKGCALQCAILCPTFKVKEFQVNESFPFPISLSWKGVAADGQQNIIVIPKGSAIPSLKAVTIVRPGTFAVDLQYADVSELQAPAKISSCTIGPFQSSKGDRAKLKVRVRLNLHGMVSIDSATADVKKKVKKTNVPVSELVTGAFSQEDLQKAVERGYELALQDRVMEETKDLKNAVEAYVYDMRNKLNDKYYEFVTPSEKKEFIARLQEVEDWWYEDGEDETKSVYIAKLDELKKKGDPIDERNKDQLERGNYINHLLNAINSYKEAAASNDPKFDHMEITEKEKVLKACVETEAWVREKKQQQDALPKYATPALRSMDVIKKAEELDRLCRPIMTKPKPAPPKPATPEPQSIRC